MPWIFQHILEQTLKCSTSYLNIVFYTYYSFQHPLKCSKIYILTFWNYPHIFELALSFSTCHDIFNKLVKNAYNFSEQAKNVNMLFYSFQQYFSIFLQNVLQISTHSEIFNTLSSMKIWNIYSEIVSVPFQNYFVNPFKNTILMLKYSFHLRYEHMKSTVVKFTHVINNIRNGVQNQVENFKAC